MIDKPVLPRQKDWDNFWSLESIKDKSQISWSKKRILAVVAPFLEIRARVLDAGCGTGFFSRHFCEQGKETVALDYSEEALKMTQQLTQGRARIIKADMLADDLDKQIPERFDFVFSDGLFEHFSSDDQDRILKNLKSLLSPEGLIVTFVPNRWSPWELIRPFVMPGIKEDPFVMSRLLDLNQRNGLQVIRSGGINVWPFAFSPDNFCGKAFGMLLFTVARMPESPKE